MSISETRKWKTNRSADEILKIMLSNLKQKKAEVTVATPKKIEATMGSGLKTRLYGGWFVSNDTLPVKMTLYLYKDEYSKETEVYATIQDNLGFGLKTGMVGKYRNYMQGLLDELVRDLQSTREVILMDDAKPKFCKSCGAPRAPDDIFCTRCGAHLSTG